MLLLYIKTYQKENLKEVKNAEIKLPDLLDCARRHFLYDKIEAKFSNVYGHFSQKSNGLNLVNKGKVIKEIVLFCLQLWKCM